MAFCWTNNIIFIVIINIVIIFTFVIAMIREQMVMSFHVSLMGSSEGSTLVDVVLINQEREK